MKWANKYLPNNGELLIMCNFLLTEHNGIVYTLDKVAVFSLIHNQPILHLA